MNNTINLAIQILPMSIDKAAAYAAVDSAIAVIQKSGLKYKVCPFETVIEGRYDAVMQVVKEMQDEVMNNGTAHIIVNIKIQRTKDMDVHIEDKLQNYK